MKCTCNSNNCPLTDSLFLTQIQACLEASPVDGLCSDSLSKYGSLSQIGTFLGCDKHVSRFSRFGFFSTQTFRIGMFLRLRIWSTCFTALPLSLLIFLPGTPRELPTCAHVSRRGKTIFSFVNLGLEGAAATIRQSNMFSDATSFISRFLCRDSKSGPASTCGLRPPPSPLTDASFSHDAVSACTLEAP